MYYCTVLVLYIALAVGTNEATHYDDVGCAFIVEMNWSHDQ
jgi:hypothetical protein